MPRTILVSELRHPDDLPGDLVPALRRASAEIADGDTLQLPAGEWDLHQECAQQTMLAVTNHDACVRTHGLLLQGLRDIAIRGDQTTLFAHGMVAPLWFEDCHGLHISGVRLDRRQYANGLGEILAVDDERIELRLDPRCNPGWYVGGGVLYLCGRHWTETLWGTFEWDTATRLPAPGSADNCGGEWSVNWRAERLDDERLALHARSPHRPRVGNHLLLRCSQRSAPGVVFSHSSDIQVSDLHVHACSGMAIIAQFCRDITLRTCSVEPRPGGLRIDADCYDATHFANCRGQITIEGCRFHNQLDDPCNVHGAYFPVLRQLDPHRLRLERRHHQQAGAPVAHAGDRLELVAARTLEAYWTGTVRQVVAHNLHTVDIVFTEALPERLQPGDAIDNIDWHPDVTLRDCDIRGNRARGPLLSTRGRVVVEGCTLTTPGAAILTAGGLGLWCESGPAHDITIRDNDFIACNYNRPHWGEAVLQFACEGSDIGQRETPYHRNITVTGNRFRCIDDHVVVARSVGGLTITGNSLRFANGGPTDEWLRTESCSDVHVADNRIG
jgi:hypothetical protein